VVVGSGFGPLVSVLGGVSTGFPFFLSSSGTVSPLDSGGLRSDSVEGFVTGCAIPGPGAGAWDRTGGVWLAFGPVLAENELRIGDVTATPF